MKRTNEDGIEKKRRNKINDGTKNREKTQRQ